MKSNLTKVGILGGSGFTGEELLRILSNHSNTQVIAVSSRELLGRSTNEIVEGSDLFFIAPDDEVFYECERYMNQSQFPAVFFTALKFSAWPTVGGWNLPKVKYTHL